MKVNDKRRWAEDYSGEVCRACGCREVHTRKYGNATMECIVWLKKQLEDKKGGLVR